MYRKEIKNWLEQHSQYPDMREGFAHAFSKSPSEYLIVPNIQDVQNGKAALISRWNEILLSTFSRTESYRASDEKICQGLEHFLEDLYAWEEECQQQEEYKLIGREKGIGQIFCIGRETEISLINKRFEESNMVFLHGQGGMGKSTVAKAYAARYRDHYDTVVFATCEKGLRKLLADDTQIKIQGISFRQNGRRGELGWYCRRKLKILKEITDSRTLLILDNLDYLDQEGNRYLEQIRELPCKILVTTRIRSSHQWKNAVEILPLSRQDRLLLFEKYYGSKLSDEMKEMAGKEMQCLEKNTLRIKQFGLRCGDNRRILEGNLCEFIESDGAIFQIDKLGVGEQNVLRNAALLPLKGIQIEQFLSYGSRMTRKQIQKLISLGLLEYEVQEERIWMHPLVKEEVVQILRPGWNSCQAYIRRFAEKMRDFWNFTTVQKQEVSDYIVSLLQNIRELDTRCMKEIMILADLIWQLGEWEYALSYTKKLYEFCRKNLGEEHRDTALAAHMTGSVYYNHNMPKQAGRWYEQAWNIYQKNEEKDPVTEACLCVKYSRFFRFTQKYDQMEKIYEKTEQIYQSALEKEKGKRERQQLEDGMINYFIERERAYLSLGRYEEALSISFQAKKYHHQWMGGNATGSYIYHDISNCLYYLGRYDEALDYLLQAKKMAEQYFQKEYGEMQVIMKDLKKLMKR